MRCYPSPTGIFAVLAILPALLAACATTQQPVARDDADRLFLKYLEITRRPSPITPDEMEETATIEDGINASKDTCALMKTVSMLKVDLLLLDNFSEGGTVADIERRNAEARQELKRLQTAPLPTQACTGRDFPQVAID